MLYEYTNPPCEARQYDDIDVKNGPVDARYVKVPGYEGNMLVEALPRPLTADEVRASYSAGLLGYGEKPVSEMSRFELLTQITGLKKWRFPLPYNVRLEEQFCISQIISYGARQPHILTDSDGSKVLVYEPSGSAPNEAFSVLGFSGSGKSTSVTQLLKGYPQVIRHRLDDDTEFLQVTYLFVTCPVNKNMSTLLDNIAGALDTAIGYASPVFAADVKRSRAIGDKAEKIASLCRRFSIGTIFIDEIQYMDFSSTRETSFNSLLTISNESGVNISVIGTEEAYSKMFSTLKMERRTGKPIIADKYCADKRFFAAVAKSLMKYHWTDYPFEPDDALIDALFEATGGIIDLLVTYWIYVNYEHNTDAKHPKINADFIGEITKKHFAMLPELLKNAANAECDMGIREIIKKKTDQLEETIAAETEKAAAEAILRSASAGEMEERNAVREGAVRDVTITARTSGVRFSENDIIKAVDHVMGLKSNLGAGEDETASLAYNWLVRNHGSGKKAVKKKKSKKDDPTVITIRTDLMESTAKAGEEDN